MRVEVVSNNRRHEKSSSNTSTVPPLDRSSAVWTEWRSLRTPPWRPQTVGTRPPPGSSGPPAEIAGTHYKVTVHYRYLSFSPILLSYCWPSDKFYNSHLEKLLFLSKIFQVHLWFFFNYSSTSISKIACISFLIKVSL